MFPTRRDLDLALDALAAGTPELMSETAHSDQMDAFTRLADELLDSAHPNDKSRVWSRLQCFQREHGLSPGDEGDPCD